MDIFPRKNKEKKDKKKGRGIGPSAEGGGSPWWANLITTLVIFLLLVVGYSFFLDTSGETSQEIPVSILARQIEAGQVERVVVQGDELTITYTNEGEATARKEQGVGLSETLKNLGVTNEALTSVNIEVTEESGLRFFLFTFGPFLIPLIFIIFFFWLLTRQVRGAGMQTFSFGQSKARVITPDDKAQRVLFSDVAGAKEAKEELTEIVDFLKNPKKFINIGARIPKGILLMGAPGTGKTLLARAVAGEAGVPFFIISGSEFVEMFVGVGASRVRDLFKLAKKAAPAIIFIDEIDAVGRVRGSGVGGGHDEREQTLNQILVEMDGFEPHEKVIIMAATNRPDVLDPALLRPGRFDRRVVIDLPDRKDREGILKIHARKKPLAEDVNLELIAQRTPGFSGADLQSLMNEGAILAARENRKKVSQFDLIRSIEKVMLGPERRSHILNKKEKEITAYHEAGHALIASVLPYADPVHKISIISRGRAAGYTLKLPDEEKRMHSKREFLDDITSTLGGYVAERMVFDDLTTGPSNDLQVLTALARNMVTKWGMSDKFGPIALVADNHQPLYGASAGEKEYSERVSAEVDAEVSRIVNDAYKRAEKILKENKDALDAIAKKLVEKETVEREEYEEVLKEYNIPIREKEDIEHSD